MDLDRRPRKYAAAFWLTRVVRRWMAYTVIMVALFALTTALRFLWEPLGMLVPILAAVLLVYLLVRALTGRWGTGSV